MTTILPGEVYAYDEVRQDRGPSWVAIRILAKTPKVVRFPTDERWLLGERVEVIIRRKDDGTPLIPELERYRLD